MQEKNSLPNLGNENTIIFGSIVGSHAYGTNIEGSDIDRKWVYVQSAEDLFINGYRPQIEISKDETAFELSRFLELARKANPTILELLYSPVDCIIYKHASFDKILTIKKTFLTKACQHSFSGYATDQIEKARGLDKKMNWEKDRTERKGVLDFCHWITNFESSYDVIAVEGDKYKSIPIKGKFSISQIKNMGLSCLPHTKDLYNLFWDVRYPFKGVVQNEETSNDISLSDVPVDANCIGLLYFNRDEYIKHCKDYKNYEVWLKERNTQRYVDIDNHGQKIDGKNMLHCIRLIETALDIANLNTVIVRRQNAEYLKEIRKGKYNLEEILEYAIEKVKEIKPAFVASTLPETYQDNKFITYVNRSIRKEIHYEYERDSIFQNKS